MRKFRTSTTLITNTRKTGDVLAYIRESIAFHKHMGFNALDFPMSLIEKYPEKWQEIAETARETAEKENIRFELCHLPFSVAIAKDESLIPDFCRRMHICIDAAAVLGVDAAALHPNCTTLPETDYNSEAEYEKNLRHLSPFAEHAARLGVTLALENMRIVRTSVPVRRFGQSPEELCRIADELGIGVCWDFGHANICKVKHSDALPYIGKRLKMLHINDNEGNEDSHIPLFIGTTDWKDAMLGLKLSCFNGLLNFELNTGKLPPELHEPFAKTMLASAEVLENYILG